MKSYKTAVKDEKNLQPLSDDYIKFIRFAQWKMDKVKKGVIGIITNNSYLDGQIHRGMREELLKSFDKIYVLNLHGNTNTGENCPVDIKDENVFDIKQGVSIIFLIKSPDLSEKGLYYDELFGTRLSKYTHLYESTALNDKGILVEPSIPEYWFVPKEIVDKQYSSSWSLADIFKEYISGVMTNDDANLISLKPSKSEFEQCYYYKPFDIRYIEYDLHKISRHRYPIMKHLLKDNLALVFRRSGEGSEWDLIHVTSHLVDKNCFVRQTYIAPLFVYDDDQRNHNFSDSFMKALAEMYGLEIEPEILFAYIYSILYSNKYRSKYHEALQSGFPRIPFCVEYDLFIEISEQGQRLIDLHLLKAEPKSMSPNPCFPVAHADLFVSKVKYISNDDKDGKVWINDTTYFDRIPHAIWNYQIGGNQVLEKWLKERKKHKYTLTGADVSHFLKVCAVLNETIEIQEKLDGLVGSFI